MILGKLPPDVRKNLAREHSNLEWTLDQLRDSIMKEIRVFEVGFFVPLPQPEITAPPLLFTQGPQADLNKGNH